MANQPVRESGRLLWAFAIGDWRLPIGDCQLVIADSQVADPVRSVPPGGSRWADRMALESCEKT